MSTAEAWTVGRLLTWTTDYLKKEGSTSPRLDAEVLLAHARKCARINLYTAFDEVPDDAQRAAFREMVKRRAEGMPVAYLVGHKEFYSLKFEVTPEVLIPRPETEHLVLAALDCAKSMNRTELQIADVCTGSGIIAVAIAKYLPSCRITATDISPAALAVARRNMELNQIDPQRINFLEGDLLASVSTATPFDMIVSNPPYVSESEYNRLDKSVRQFEPRLALVAGPTGGEIIQRLLVEAVERLQPGGFLIFEFSPMLADHLPGWVGPAWLPPKIIKDYADHARVVTLQKHPAPNA